jgi:DNA adenine methylase
MAYLGGKSTSAEHIIDILNNPIFNDLDYVEPFCGYCHILRRVENKASYTVSDNNDLLITLLKHVQKTKGDHPNITKSEYATLRETPSKDKLRAAYAAFCYSYNGKFFGGYVNKYKGRNYPNERKRYYDLLHDNTSFHKAVLRKKSYAEYKGLKGAIIYCDPPYENTTEYHSEFDSAAFWDWVRETSKDNYVFVSEYTAPDDFVCISKKTKRNSLAGQGATRKRQEKVFVHSSVMKSPALVEIMKTAKYPCRRSKTLKVKVNLKKN